MMLLGSDSKENTQRIDDALTPLDPSIFLKATLRNHSCPTDCVLDSLRFVNDLNEVKGLGFVTLRVHAGEKICAERLRNRGQIFSKASQEHRTEIELEAVDSDYQIINEGTTQELKASVRRLVRAINSKN